MEGARQESMGEMSKLERGNMKCITGILEQHTTRNNKKINRQNAKTYSESNWMQSRVFRRKIGLDMFLAFTKKKGVVKNVPKI